MALVVIVVGCVLVISRLGFGRSRDVLSRG
jgi:hypothetical protein